MLIAYEFGWFQPGVLKVHYHSLPSSEVNRVRNILSVCSRYMTFVNERLWPKAEVRQSMSALASCVELHYFVSDFIFVHSCAKADIDLVQIFPICRSIALSARSLRSLYRSVR